MEKTLSKTLWVLCILTLLISLFGCNNGGETSSKNSETNNTSGDNVTQSLQQYDFADNTVLKTLSTGDLGDMSEFYEKFKELYGKNITVEADVVSWGQLQSKLAVLISSDDSPDFFGIESVCTPWYIRNNLFQDITKYIDMNHSIWSGLKGYVDHNSYKGVQYGVPLSSPFNMYAILYHTDLIEAAGLEDPRALFYKGEWTWTKFAEYANELTEKDSQGNTTVFGGSLGADYTTMFWGASTGNDVIKFDSDGKVVNNLNDPAWARAADFIYKQNNSGNYVGLQEQEASKMFKAGKIAMIYTQFWWSASDEQLAQLFKDGKVSFAPTPRDPESSEHYVYAWSNDFFICNGAKNPQAAAAYLTAQRYLTLNPSESDKQKQHDEQINKWGFSEEDIKLGYTDMQNMKFVYTFSTQLPGFEKKTTLWNNIALESWPSVVADVSPSLDEAIRKINK